jgi:esterase/lipase
MDKSQIIKKIETLVKKVKKVVKKNDFYNSEKQNRKLTDEEKAEKVELIKTRDSIAKEIKSLQIQLSELYTEEDLNIQIGDKFRIFYQYNNSNNNEFEIRSELVDGEYFITRYKNGSYILRDIYFLELHLNDGLIWKIN